MGGLECLRYVLCPVCIVYAPNPRPALSLRVYFLVYILVFLNLSRRYVHENGCGWTKHTCTSAAAAGNLECLRYGSPYSSYSSFNPPLTFRLDMHTKMGVIGINLHVR